MTADRKPQRATKRTYGNNPRLHIHIPDHRPSWKRYGSGVGNIEFDFYRSGVLGIAAEETYFASKAAGEKRDISRMVMLELSRESAEQLHAMLTEHLAREG